MASIVRYFPFGSAINFLGLDFGAGLFTMYKVLNPPKNREIWFLRANYSKFSLPIKNCPSSLPQLW